MEDVVYDQTTSLQVPLKIAKSYHYTRSKIGQMPKSKNS